jgi:hypothetical protein
VIACRLNPDKRIIGVFTGKKNAQLSLHFLKAAAKIIRLDEIPTGKRATSGKKLIEVKPGDRVTGLVSMIDCLEYPVEKKPKGRKKTKS